MISKILLLLLFILPLSAGDEFEVRLTTEARLLPIQIEAIKAWPEAEEVLRFDFSHNGSTTVVKGGKPFYVLSSSFDNNALKVTVKELETGKTYSYPPIEKDGNFRAHIHELSDAIHKSLFGVPGIAATKILYTTKKKIAPGEYSGEVWIADYDGSKPRQLTSQQSICVTPSFIPPAPGKIGKNYLYVCYKTGQPKIYHATLDGGNGDRIIPLRGNQFMPDLSRSRDRLAFISDAAGNPDLFMQNFDPQKGPIGKPRQIYAVPYATQASPSFSPDGSKIALVSNKDGSPKIYLIDVPSEGMKINEIKAELLIKKSAAATAPQWSPDGSKIAYTAKAEGGRQIWVYDLNTRENKQITFGGGDKENPTWAPNALHIAYNMQSGENSDIYMLNINELKPTKITSGAGEKKYPSWEKR